MDAEMTGQQKILLAYENLIKFRVSLLDWLEGCEVDGAVYNAIDEMSDPDMAAFYGFCVNFTA